tara:strand:+ start:553 stop:1350 length:798 start_codon:yes stop_codon:yes gene_type:complete
MSIILPEIVDSHCHLDFPELVKDIDNVISRAKRRGVCKFVTICTKEEDLEKVISLAESFKEIYFAFGLHPMNVSGSSKISLESLLEAANHPKMVGIGETGLDYYYTVETKELQIESLITHIVAARKTNLPLIIHSRNADEDMGNILVGEFNREPFKCVMHCFSSGEKLARVTTDLGFYLSMSGIITFPKSEDLRKIFSKIDKNLILLETDSPYLAPVPNRGKKNEPAFTADTAKVGAEIFKLSEYDFRRLTTENFYNLFEKVGKP